MGSSPRQSRMSRWSFGARSTSTSCTRTARRGRLRPSVTGAGAPTSTRSGRRTRRSWPASAPAPTTWWKGAPTGALLLVLGRAKAKPRARGLDRPRKLLDEPSLVFVSHPLQRRDEADAGHRQSVRIEDGRGHAPDAHVGLLLAARPALPPNCVKLFEQLHRVGDRVRLEPHEPLREDNVTIRHEGEGGLRECAGVERPVVADLE